MGKKPTSHTFSHLYYSATMTSLFWRLRQKDRAGNGNVLGQDLSVKRQQRIQDLSVKRQQRIHDLSVKRQQRIHDLSVKGQLRIHLGHFVSLRLCFVWCVHVSQCMSAEGGPKTKYVRVTDYSNWYYTLIYIYIYDGHIHMWCSYTYVSTKTFTFH